VLQLLGSNTIDFGIKRKQDNVEEGREKYITTQHKRHGDLFTWVRIHKETYLSVEEYT
jgi:hypothetical protein